MLSSSSSGSRAWRSRSSRSSRRSRGPPIPTGRKSGGRVSAATIAQAVAIAARNGPVPRLLGGLERAVLQIKEPCASRVRSHLPPIDSTQRPHVDGGKASLLPFNSTAASLDTPFSPPPAATMGDINAAAGAGADAAHSSCIEVVGSFNTMAAVAACLDPEEQHVQANADVAAGTLPTEPAPATLGVVPNRYSSGYVSTAAAIADRWEEGVGRESAASPGMVSQGPLGTVVAPPLTSSPTGGVLVGRAVGCRERGAKSMAGAAAVDDMGKGCVGSLQLAGAAPVLSRRDVDVNRSASVTFAVKPEPSVYALAEVLGTRVQLGKGNVAPPLAARGSAATTVAVVAEASASLSSSPPPAATGRTPAAAAAAILFAVPLAANANAAPPVTSAIVQLPAAPAAAVAAEDFRTAGAVAAGATAITKAQIASVPTEAEAMMLPEHGAFSGSVDQVEAAGPPGARQYGIEKQHRAKGTLSKNSSRDTAGNEAGGECGKTNGRLGQPIPSNTASEPEVRAAVPYSVCNTSNRERGTGAPRGVQGSASVAAAVKSELPAVGGSLGSVPATAAAQEPPLPPLAGSSVAAAVLGPEALCEGGPPISAPAKAVLGPEALTTGEMLLPHIAAEIMAQQVKLQKPSPGAADAAATVSGAAAAEPPVPLSIATTAAAAAGPISGAGRTAAAAAAEGLVAAVEGPAAVTRGKDTAATNDATKPAAIGVQSSDGTQAAADAATAAAGRVRGAPNTSGERSQPIQAATAAEVIVIDDSDGESAELAAGVLAVGERGAVLQQPGEVRGRAGVKQERDCEGKKAPTSATVAAVEVCRVQAAVLGQGVPAAPMQAAVEAQAALALAGEHMATKQQPPGVLELELIPVEAVGLEGGVDMTAPGAPGRLAAGGGAGSGDVAGVAAPEPAIGLVAATQEAHVTAAFGSKWDRPLEVGLFQGEQGGHAIPNMQRDAAAGCSAGRGAAAGLLVRARLQGMPERAEGAAVGSIYARNLAPKQLSSAADGINGAAHTEQLRPDHGRSPPAAAAHPLLPAAPAIAATATAAGASCVGVAAGTCGANPNQVAAAGAEQHRLKDASSVHDYALKDTGNVVQAALEVMQLCKKLKVSLGWSNMV